MAPSAHLRSVIQQTKRVIRLLSANNEPIPIPDSEIERIRSLLAGRVPVSHYAFLQSGQKVRIRGGCLDGLEGILVVRNGERNLVLSVNLIQRSLALSIEGYKIDPL
jgi:transcription antitermination factor NusG